MDQDLSLSSELGTWLKSDLLCEFSDLLDDGPVSASLRGREPAILGSEDLLEPSKDSPIHDRTDREAIPTDWLKSLMTTHDAPNQPLTSQPQQTFPGFPAAGALNVQMKSHDTSTAAKFGSSPLSCSRCPENDSSMPSSWESNLSQFSLRSSLADFSSVPDLREPMLKSEDSFNCSFEAFYQEEEQPKEKLAAPAKKCKTGVKSDGPKASLADRNRERQQRFRQRQKAKIESLENQVVKLTAQTQMLLAEKANMGSQSAKLSELLQDKERMVAMLSTQVSQGQFDGPSSGPTETLDVPQISLTYCNPPLLLTSKQIAKMDALDLTKLWKEYVWALSNLLKTANPAQWSTELERLDALTAELVQLVMHLWDSCPDFGRIKVSGFADSDSHRRDESEDENWRNIASQIPLIPEQIQQLSVLRHTMRTRLQGIWSARREAQVKLMACYDETAITSRDLLQQHQKVKQINEALTNGIKEENLLARDFEFAFYKKVLRAEQRAHCIVHSYPRFPDSQALANWLAACHGDSEAHSLMTTHATSSSTSFHSS